MLCQTSVTTDWLIITRFFMFFHPMCCRASAFECAAPICTTWVTPAKGHKNFCTWLTISHYRSTPIVNPPYKSLQKCRPVDDFHDGLDSPNHEKIHLKWIEVPSLQPEISQIPQSWQSPVGIAHQTTRSFSMQIQHPKTKLVTTCHNCFIFPQWHDNPQ